MSFDCYRCWNTGAYLTNVVRYRYLRCTVCNSNFGDPRSGEEIAADVGYDKVPYSGMVGSCRLIDVRNPVLILRDRPELAPYCRAPKCTGCLQPLDNDAPDCSIHSMFSDTGAPMHDK